jgi:3-hydroxyisobutyrate dehydrogenase
MTSVAFIGLGNMGSHMCRHVAQAGFDVTAYDLNAEAVARAAADGARAATSLTAAVRDAEILITSLPGPAQVDEVLTAPDGAMAGLQPGGLIIEMSTSSLEIGRRAQAFAIAHDIQLVDAPVAGQTIGAEAGTLAIYVGGEPAAVARARPVLEAIGDPARIFHLGPPGSGYAVKLLLNLLWFVQTVATAEALTIGVRAGVALDTLHAALVSSPANSVFLERDVLPLLHHGDYDEGFAMQLVTKDLGLAVDLARDVGVPAELAALVDQIHRRAHAAYGDHAGEMSVIRLYEDLTRTELRWPSEELPWPT